MTDSASSNQLIIHVIYASQNLTIRKFALRLYLVKTVHCNIKPQKPATKVEYRLSILHNAAGLGALYGHLFLHVMQVSVQTMILFEPAGRLQLKCDDTR